MVKARSYNWRAVCKSPCWREQTAAATKLERHLATFSDAPEYGFSSQCPRWVRRKREKIQKLPSFVRAFSAQAAWSALFVATSASASRPTL